MDLTVSQSVSRKDVDAFIVVVRKTGCCQENCFFVNRMASQIGRNGAGICSLFLIETVAMGMLSIPLHVFSPFLWYL